MTGPEIVARVASQMDFSGLSVHQIAHTAILATLDAVREPSEAMLEAGRGGPELDLASVFGRMIDALKADIAG